MGRVTLTGEAFRAYEQIVEHPYGVFNNKRRLRLRD